MMLAPGGLKIWRPRQLYVGSPVRDYVDLENRADEVQNDPKTHPSLVRPFALALNLTILKGDTDSLLDLCTILCVG